MLLLRAAVVIAFDVVFGELPFNVITKSTTEFELASHWPEPLEERLHLYQEDSSLATKKPNFTHFPPDFQPIACKPLFFDVALSLADYPSLEDKLDQKKQGGGISGFVKGWLWGGGKK
ncbi:hypothetical protein CAPTEDRAFT_222435 [Capitella teleta]|uniref:Uncharacterized protein n=1 Tax=Capitella teleta TaxID=283909 RepID=R7US53_CAPTE|nr:hypothetical protein CAPTEDRAFT_222435 [Capitella teleta]|eukprot:ELU08968.1 hypothetical protein CAPTEDRAFT_222435 [Capitella teleta]